MFVQACGFNQVDTDGFDEFASVNYKSIYRRRR